jgi:RNA ligase (TIGR02306 family)
MKRKLASVQLVESIEPIPNADFIEKVKVLGWNLVARKGEFHKHDKCIYFEIDSILPDVEAFAFLKSKEGKAIRLRTKKMKKVISQGLALPFETMHDFMDSREVSKLSVGTEVTDVIGVRKYEPPISGSSSSKGYWPFFIPKTDETRVQSSPEALEEMQGLHCYATVKLDGCSCTFSYKDGEFEVCSRNWALKDTSGDPQIKDDRWWTIAHSLKVEDRIKEQGNYAVQGELCGPGIQSNRLGLDSLNFFVFNVYDLDKQCYLDYVDMMNFCQKAGFVTVPIEKEFMEFDLNQDDMLGMAEGKYVNTKTQREGLVFRPVKEIYSEALGGRLSLKAISNKFLLKGGD